MPKKKVSTVETQKKEKIFYYEIIGIVCLIISAFSFTKLGLFGTYLMLTFRLLFGDWYFIFTFLLFIYGLYCLLVHKRLKVVSIRFLGIFLITLSLIVLSHFSMFKYIKSFDDNHLKLMFNLYLSYFKDNVPSKMIGGGIIGGTIFHLCYYLFSSIGTILLMIFVLFVGIVFVCKKTFKDFVLMIKNFFVKVFNIIINIFKKLKKDAESIDEEYKNNKNKKRYFNKSMLVNYKFDNTDELNNIKNNIILIKKTLEELEVMYKKIDYLLGFHISSIYVYILYEFDFSYLYDKLNKYIKNKYLIKYNPDECKIIIEINNLVPRFLNFKYALKNTDDFVIGIDEYNNLIKVDNNILILGNDLDIRKYLESLVLYPMFSKNNRNDEIYLFDLYNKMSDLSKYVDKYFTSFLEIGSMNEDIEKVLNELNDTHYPNIEKYNLNNQTKFNKKFIFINGLEKILSHTRITEKFEYLLRLSVQTGYYFIVTYSSNSILSSNILSLFEYKIMLQYQNQVAGELIPESYFKVINSNVEGFIKWRDLIIRMCLLKITEEEKKNMKI